MAETEKQVAEMTVPDAPKKNAVAAENSPLSNSAEDLGAAVVKPTDSNPDATKKVKEVSGDAQQKNSGSADPMPSVKKEETDSDGEKISEGDMPDGLKKFLDKKKDKAEKEEGYKMKKESEADDKDAKSTSKESTDQKAKDIDVKEHIDALTSGESDLSEEFKLKAATIFEAAITSKVKEIAEEMEVDYNKKFDEESAKAKSELVEKVDNYLNYVVNEWMKENELAIETGVKVEMAESLMTGLKSLFEEHNIEIDDETIDVVAGLEEEVEELKTTANEKISENVDLQKQIAALNADRVFDEMTEDLTITQRERLKVLSEKLDVQDIAEYQSDLTTLKESFFKKAAPLVEEVQEEQEIITEETKVAKPASEHSSINALVESLNARQK